MTANQSLGDFVAQKLFADADAISKKLQEQQSELHKSGEVLASTQAKLEKSKNDLLAAVDEAKKSADAHAASAIAKGQKTMAALADIERDKFLIDAAEARKTALGGLSAEISACIKRKFDAEGAELTTASAIFKEAVAGFDRRAEAAANLLFKKSERLGDALQEEFDKARPLGMFWQAVLSMLSSGVATLTCLIILKKWGVI